MHYKAAYSNFGEEIKVSGFVGQRCAKRGLSPDAMKWKRFWIVPVLDESKRPFSNLFPRGEKSKTVDFSKIIVSLDFLGTFLIKQKGVNRFFKKVFLYFCLATKVPKRHG